jgi:N-acetylneuraminic acid mutarotase
MKPFYLFLLLFVSTALLSAQQEWEQVSSLPNNIVSDHSYGFALNDKGYLVAGGNQFGYLNGFYEYDPVLDEWTQLDAFPGGDRGFGIGDTWDGKAYFGFGYNGFAAQRDIWVFDPDTEEWTELTSCPCEARLHPAFIVHNDKIFVGLGSSLSSNLNDWWEYDMISDTWSQKPSFPALPRHHPFQFAMGDYIYTGFGHGNTFISNEWYRYDPANEEWTQVATLPGEGRVAGTQFSFNGKGYILSGDGGDHTSMEEGEFWSYDPELDLWEQLPSHPGWSRWAPTSFIINGWVYLLSGPTNIGGSLNYSPSNNYRFQLEETAVSNQEVTAEADLFEVFPNPFASRVELNWTGDYAGTAGELRVINSLGRVVLQNSQLTNSLDLGFLPAGIYHIEAIVGEKRVVKRVVKE